MKRISMRRAFAYASVLVATLALAPSAFAHAELFPSTVPAGDGQLLMLTVPNEKESASTTEIQITIPNGFDLEHVAPVPNWTATVSGQHHENGEMAGGDSITWKGKLERRGARRAAVHGRRPRTTVNTRSTCARPTRTAASSSGPAPRTRTRPRRASRRPAPARRAARATPARPSRSSRSSSARSPSSSAARRSSPGGVRREHRRAGGRAARRLRGRAGGAGGGVGTRLAARHATAGERRARPPADRGHPHLQRAHRAALRRHLGHGRAGHAADRRRPGRTPPATPTRSSCR